MAEETIASFEGECADAAELAAKQVASLLDRLRLRRWKIGIPQYSAATDVYLAMIGEGRELVRNAIGPIVCQNVAQQEQFPHLFDDWWNSIGPETKHNAVAPTEEKSVPPARGVRWLLISAITLMVIAIAFIAVTALSTGTEEQTPPTQVPEATPIAPAPSGWPTLTIASGIAGAAVALLWAASLFARDRRRLELRRVFGVAGAFEQRLLSVGTSAIIPEQIRRTARELRARRAIAAQELDPERTVLATARQGYFRAEYSARNATPEYLILVDQRTARDHLARFVLAMIRQLTADDVQVQHYQFRRDPRICWREDAPARSYSISDLSTSHRDHRLIIVSDAAGLANPFTGDLEEWLNSFSFWNERALLTPSPVSRWGKKEQQLGRNGFIVLPAGLESLAVLVEMLRLAEPSRSLAVGRGLPLPLILSEKRVRWTDDRAPDATTVARLLEELYASLGARTYVWLAACAVYPALHWELTVHLGRRLHVVENFDKRLVELARLPWFRQSRMPDWLRVALIDSVAPDDRRFIREAVQELLETSLREVGTYYDLPIAARRGWWSRLRWSRILTDLRVSTPHGGALHDHVLLDFLREKKPGPPGVPFASALLALLRPVGAQPAESRAGRVLARTADRLIAWRAFMRVLAYLPVVAVIPFAASRGRDRNLREHSAEGIVLFAFVMSWTLSIRALPTHVEWLILFTWFTYAVAVIAGITFALQGRRLRIPILNEAAAALAKIGGPRVAFPAAVARAELTRPSQNVRRCFTPAQLVGLLCVVQFASNIANTTIRYEWHTYKRGLSPFGIEMIEQWMPLLAIICAYAIDRFLSHVYALSFSSTLMITACMLVWLMPENTSMEAIVFALALLGSAVLPYITAACCLIALAQDGGQRTASLAFLASIGPLTSAARLFLDDVPSEAIIGIAGMILLTATLLLILRKLPVTTQNSTVTVNRKGQRRMLLIVTIIVLVGAVIAIGCWSSSRSNLAPRTNLAPLNYNAVYAISGPVLFAITSLIAFYWWKKLHITPSPTGTVFIASALAAASSTALLYFNVRPDQSLLYVMLWIAWIPNLVVKPRLYSALAPLFPTRPATLLAVLGGMYWLTWRLSEGFWTGLSTRISIAVLIGCAIVSLAARIDRRRIDAAFNPVVPTATKDTPSA